MKETPHLRTSYTLVVCEKPDSARRVSEALAETGVKADMVEGTAVFRFSRGGEDYVVCSAQGHLYGVSDPTDERVVYPVFDVEWYPTSEIDEDRGTASRRISAIRKLAAGASKFVNACDFDAEGETIGFNILRYACGCREDVALRAKFSTLTREDLIKAFAEAKRQAGNGLARAGRARHAIDFVWGVNLSRVLSQSSLRSGHRYRTVSMGRVQGPTLEFLAKREVEVRTFVPVPYWKVSVVLLKDGRKIAAEYSKERVDVRKDAESIRDECMGKEAEATEVHVKMNQVGPPTPFNIGDLQKEAYRAFRLSPSRTLQLAERLYLGALISYPRTGSQRLPPSIGYGRIVSALGRIPEYSEDVTELLRGNLKPVQGPQDDQAHPAIYPTGEGPARPLDGAEASVYDLVVRRFLSAFGQSALREQIEVRLRAGLHEFRVAGSRTVSPGWMRYYGRYAGYKDVEVPAVAEGDRFKIVEVNVKEEFRQKPLRYNQSSLLERMEKERIGTKATRADIIATLVNRGYAAGESMEVTDLGLSVAETMAKHAPSILTTQLTRDVEGRLEAIEDGSEAEVALLRETVRSVSEQLVSLNEAEEALGLEIDAALMSGLTQANVLGGCPVCKTGQLRMITSKKTKKRFVGCSNYAAGCRASAPLPQRGAVRPGRRPCVRCSWPVVYVMGGRAPWKLCVNPKCPTKEKRRRTNEVQAV